MMDTIDQVITPSSNLEALGSIVRPIRQLRCNHKLHGILLEDHKIEFSCDSRLCGKRPGVVVLHTIDLLTGECDTRRYKQPPNERELNGTCG